MFGMQWVHYVLDQRTPCFACHKYIVLCLGHAAMEAACCNLVEKGDVVLSLVNGVWGGRFADMATRQGKSLNDLSPEVYLYDWLYLSSLQLFQIS